jgi:outer membrane lipopolysaccharide assembly protein LptE/RlpB
MKTLTSLAALSLLAACGAETVGTAAIQAKAREQEMQAAREAQEQIRQQMEQSLQTSLRRQEEAEGKQP